MVILELDILKKGSEVGIRIGNPISFEDGISSNSEKKESHSDAAPQAKSVTSTNFSSGGKFF